MKRSWKTLLATCAIAVTALIAPGIQSKAATSVNMGVHQTDADSDSVEIAWNAQLGYKDYHIEMSTDNRNWTDMDYSYSPSDRINSLSENQTYYVRIIAYQDSHWSNDHIRNTAAVSESIRVCTTPIEPTELKQTAATKNSVTLSWKAVAGATSYEIYRLNSSYNWDKIATSSKNSVTIGGLKKSDEFKYCVAAVKNVEGYNAVGSQSDGVYAKTTPSKVKNIDMTYFWGSLKECKYEWSSVNNADGYQYEVRKTTGKKVYDKKTTTSTGAYFRPYPQGTFIKARVRAYVTVNGKKVYGAWSDYTYSGISKSATVKRSRNGKKIYLNWKKVSGASEYRIYISTSSNKGFKKVATVSSKKAAKYTITKCNKKNLKKGKTYYVQIRYVTKVGKKKVVSTAYSQATVY